MIGKMLAWVFLSKDARRKLDQQRAVARAKKGGPRKKAPTTAREAELQQIQDQGKELFTEDRRELIRNAMKVQAAKQKILADLSDEDRQKLVTAAMKNLLNEDPEKQQGDPPDKKGKSGK